MIFKDYKEYTKYLDSKKKKPATKRATKEEK